MNEIQPKNRIMTWEGDMCFGIISTKSHSTRLTASSDGLVLDGPLGKTFKLEASKVRLIELGKSSVWFLSGQRTGCIQIHHEVVGVPEELLFSARASSAEEVAQELKKLGYKVG